MRPAPVRWFVLAFSLALVPVAAAQTPAGGTPPDARVAELHAKLARELQQISSDFDGVMGIAVKDLLSGETFEINADVVFPQASSIKIPILAELFRQAQAGGLRLEERVEVKRTEVVGGSGVLQHFGEATSAISLRDLAVLMIVLSDNTATNVLIDRVGMANVNRMLERLGLRQTRLQRKMMDLQAQRSNRENLSTPREMTTLLELLYQGKLLDPAHTAEAMEILKYAKDTALRRGLPGTVALADKPGGIEGVRCDSGVVLLPGRPYLISVMTTHGRDPEAAERAITDVLRVVFAYFERLARSNAYGVRVP
jgi:beta-lactamase class A